MDLTLSSIADIVEGTFTGDGEKIITNVASFETAGQDNITFAGDPRYIKKISEINAGAVIVPQGTEGVDGNIVYVNSPRIAFATLMDLFNPVCEPFDSIHPSVVTGNGFSKGENVMLKPGVVICENVTIGNRVVLHPNVVIGDGVRIGSDVTIYPNASILENCIIGDRVVIHAGTVIGSDGYGFVPDGEKYTKIRHIGIVRIGNDIEIGAANTIDRGTYGETWIKDGVKTDNQVHVAHNVIVGENTLLVAQVGIAGSTVIGNHAILAGRCGVAGHLKIGNNAVIGPGAGILKSVDDNDVVSGMPGMPHKVWLRVQNIISGLPEMKRQLRKMEKRLGSLENTGE